MRCVVYYTVDREMISEFVVEKSKFISHIKPVDSEIEAEEFIAQIRKKHYNATHNVPIYVIGEKYEVQKYSDDGEPAKTAGVPVLEMLKKRSITNVCIVITRYFGGIKLGTGGLVRAYTHAAQFVLEQAGIKRVDEYSTALWEYEYTYHDKIQHLLSDYFHRIEKIEYMDCIKMQIIMNVGEYDILLEKVKELTSNKLKVSESRIVLLMI